MSDVLASFANGPSIRKTDEPCQKAQSCNTIASFV